MTLNGERKASQLDIDIYVEVVGRYGNLSYRDAVYRVAAERRMTPQGVYGVINRAKTDYRGILALMKHNAKNKPEQTPAQREITKIVQDGRGIDTEYRQTMQRNYANRLATAVFVSDIHFPSADFQAVELTLKIIEYLNPNIVSSLNDGMDLPRMSKHDDTRRLDELWFDSDISNVVTMYVDYLRTLRMVAPLAMLPAIGSNHDKRVATSVDRETKVSVVSDTVVANVMEQLSSAGVVFLDTIAKENVYRLNDKLAWMHGITAAAAATSRVKRNFEYFQRNYPGELTDIVSGHFHKSATTKHPDVLGVTLYESGCLCRKDMPYLAHGASWDNAIVVSRYEVGGKFHETNVIRFNEIGSRYVAIVDGKTFSV
jgi:hypothetical protein